MIKRIVPLTALLAAGLTLGLATPAHADPTVTVVKVADGDTFTIAGGQKVRVLGIDSCEMGTKAGPEAKTTAAALLAGGVTLRTQPGAPDKDRFGRLLRYVTLDSGSDFGEAMVGHDHTGVYAGKNDAFPSYVTKLRSCGHPHPTAAAWSRSRGMHRSSRHTRRCGRRRPSAPRSRCHCST